MTEKQSTFDKLLQAHRASEREAMSMASVAQFVEDHHLATHNAHRMNAQVDAMLRAKYAECGQPDVYQPPEIPGEEDGVGTMINCTFNGDEAVDKIAVALGQTHQQKTGQAPPPPPPPPPRPNGNGNTLAKAALIGAGLLGGGGMTYVGLKALDRPANPSPVPESIYSIEAYQP